MRGALPRVAFDTVTRRALDDPGDALIALASAIDRYGEPLVTVVDDLHLLESPETDAVIAGLLAALPENWTLSIATRTEPAALPIARLRASLELTEVHAGDLAFTLDECTELLEATTGHCVSCDLARTLLDSTEGWPAGLRLAALELARVGDDATALRWFGAAHPSVAAYFASEVFEPLPEELREFLLRTAVLEEVSPATAAAVGGRGRRAAQARGDT